MEIGKEGRKRLFVEVVLVWTVALVLALVGGLYTSYSNIQILSVVGVLGTLASVVLQSYPTGYNPQTEDEAEHKRGSEAASGQSYNSQSEDGTEYNRDYDPHRVFEWAIQHHDIRLAYEVAFGQGEPPDEYFENVE